MLFENEICSRCRGTGKYSFCEMYRDICFKCGGTKFALTKRGLAARAFFEEISSVQAKEIKIGDRILTSQITMRGGISYYIATVSSIKLSELYGTGVSGGGDNRVETRIDNGQVTTTKYLNGVIVSQTIEPYLRIGTKHDRYGYDSFSCSGSTKIRVYGLDQKDRIARALAYQNTLTKTGRPKKALLKSSRACTVKEKKTVLK